MTSVVLFDLDDTIFAHRQAVERGIASHLASSGVTTVDPGEIARWTELEERHYHRYLTGELDYLGQRRARARDFGAPYGLRFTHDSEAEGWFEEYLDHYRAAWSLYDDTLPCLDALTQRGMRLGIITNGDKDFQQAKLARMGLEGRFKHVVASGSVGITKPDARIFELACGLFGVPASDALYIGDRLATDAVGARDAGLRGVWLVRDGSATADEVGAAEASGVTVIRSLAELPALL
ncbi:MAG: HAD family hydrolase [Rhodoglobus sp.]